MVSPSRLEGSSATKKTASFPSIGSSSNQPAASTPTVSSYRLGTAAMFLPSLAATVDASGDDVGPSTPPARALPEHMMSSENNNHDESDSAYSSFSATHALVDGDNNSDSTSASTNATNPNGVPQPFKARAPKEALGKHVRTDSNASPASSSAAATVPAKKRVRTNELMRSAPRATSTTTAGGLAGNSEFMSFTSTIFIIQLGGTDGVQFHVHESVLKRSPKFAEEIDKAKANKRATKQNTLPLMAHNPIAFEQMIKFLYQGEFSLFKDNTTPLERLEEFKELMSIAKHYVLPGLQKQIVEIFSSSEIMANVPQGVFFDWAEDMYSEELDHGNGPFKVYLAKVAPTLMKGTDKATKKALFRMVKQGGGFAEQLFIAATTALDTQTDLLSVKKEEANDNPLPTLPRTTRGKGKEPVRQTVREEALDMPKDESMKDDDDNIFVQN